MSEDPNFYNGWPMSTPMDIRLGQTREEDVSFPLRWGIILVVSCLVIAALMLESLYSLLTCPLSLECQALQLLQLLMELMK